jgi:hypothetical protein
LKLLFQERSVVVEAVVAVAASAAVVVVVIVVVIESCLLSQSRITVAEARTVSLMDMTFFQIGCGWDF